MDVCAEPAVTTSHVSPTGGGIIISDLLYKSLCGKDLWTSVDDSFQFNKIIMKKISKQKPRFW